MWTNHYVNLSTSHSLSGKLVKESLARVSPDDDSFSSEEVSTRPSVARMRVDGAEEREVSSIIDVPGSGSDHKDSAEVVGTTDQLDWMRATEWFELVLIQRLTGP